MLSRSGSFSSTRSIQPSGSELTAASSAEKLQALSGLLVRNESGILRLARPPNTKCFPPRPYGRRPIAEYLLVPKQGPLAALSHICPPLASWFPHFDKPAAHCNANTQEWLCSPQDVLGPRAPGCHKTCCERFQKLRTWPKTRPQIRARFWGPKMGPV